MKNHPDSEPSSFTPEVITELTGPRHLTSSQAKAHQILFALASLRGQCSDYAGMKPRARPLLIGHSGAGKTAVVRRLADSLSGPGNPFPLLPVNLGSFIPVGARHTPTLTVIRDFIRQNPPGCMFLDEIDKVTPSSHGWPDGYTCSVVSEALALLDGDGRLMGAGWDRQDIVSLSRWLVIGAGSFQRHVTPSGKKGSYAARIRSDAGIPEEVLLRFNLRYIHVDLPTRKDFRMALSRLYKDLALPYPEDGLLGKLLDEAESSHAGMRWMEQHLSDLLCVHPSKIRPPEPTGRKSLRARVSDDHLQEEFNEFFRLLDNLEPRIAVLRCQWRLHAQQLNQALAPEHPDPFTPEGPSIDVHLRDIQDALCFRYDMKFRGAREKALWISGHVVVQAMDTLLKKVTKYLQLEGLLSNFALTQARLRRVLEAMSHLEKLQGDGA